MVAICQKILSQTPSIGSTVKTKDGLAVVTDVNLITGNLMVKPLEEDSIPFKVHRDDVKIVSRQKRTQNKENIAQNDENQ